MLGRNGTKEQAIQLLSLFEELEPHSTELSNFGRRMASIEKVENKLSNMDTFRLLWNKHTKYCYQQLETILKTLKNPKADEALLIRELKQHLKNEFSYLN